MGSLLTTAMVVIMLRDIDDVTDDGGDDGEDENDGDEVDLFYMH